MLAGGCSPLGKLPRHSIAQSQAWLEKTTTKNYIHQFWLVVLTILKNISQWEGLSIHYGKIKYVPNHQPEFWYIRTKKYFFD